MKSCPAALIAAPASNQGKTTVVAALARLHSRRGLRVRIFKCGPDFLDPQILAAASGAPVYNLDLWMCGEQDASARLYAAATEADLILVESVMGLYDGSPSSAEIARRFRLPVLAVIDAAKMAQTFGAVALGLSTYGASLAFAGVLANRVSGPSHAAMVRDSLPPALEWLGALARDIGAALPERHLGLYQAAEIDDLLTRIDRVADALESKKAADLPPPVNFAAEDQAALPPILEGLNIAIARDAAFSFIYPANLDCLTALGARLAFFSPLSDRALPPCDALWLPGGYPELHLTRLSANAEMQAAIRAHHACGKPIVGECGGMLYLLQSLTTKDGESARLAGLLPGRAVMQARLAALGLQRVSLPEGELRGHTFHYSRIDTSTAPIGWSASPNGGRVAEPVYRLKRLTATYAHCYFPSNPEATARLFMP